MNYESEVVPKNNLRHLLSPEILSNQCDLSSEMICFVATNLKQFKYLSGVQLFICAITSFKLNRNKVNGLMLIN